MAGERFELSSHSWRHNGATAAEAVNPTEPVPYALNVLNRVHFHYPSILFVIFVLAFITNTVLTIAPVAETNGKVLLGPGGKPLPKSARKAKEERERLLKLREFSPGRKVVFLYLAAGLLATFVANGAEVIIHALTKSSDKGWWCGKEMVVYVCGSAFFYSVFLISMVDSSPAPNISHQITWICGLFLELVLLGATLAYYTDRHSDTNSLEMHSAKTTFTSPTEWDAIEITIAILRVIILLASVGFYMIFSFERIYKSNYPSRQDSNNSDENAPLLVNGQANGHSHVPDNGAIQNDAARSSSENGTAEVNTNGDATGPQRNVDENPAFYKPVTLPSRTWWEYLRSYSLFFPYLWPSKSLRLKLIVCACFILVLLQRLVNIAVPLALRSVTNKLIGGDKKTPGSPETFETQETPWMAISILIGLKYLQGTSGALGAIRSILWIPVSQYSYQALTTASFEHVHSLSLDFHLGKRTGEVLSALSKGNAINNFLEQLTFSVIPMVVDLGAAIILFSRVFDAYYALIVSVVTFAYLYLTIRMARWRSEQRRQMTALSREEDAVKNDSLTSYETVKYFNAEEYEFSRYRGAVVAFQKMEYKVTISLNILNISQNMVFMTGLLATSFICAYQITTGKRKVGDFVLMIAYMSQLQTPLNFFGTFYRSIQSAMISGERLLELFKEQPTVTDDPSAKPMPDCEGEIRFQNVRFSYDSRKPALEDLSFTCRPGTTTALVGESGGGKSTVFRLIYRYYNALSGSIQVDGNDIQDVTIDSVRRHIGVVPQDTVLFNETIMYNLKYANQDATDEDVYAACRAASIHDKIVAFPDGYNTKVGERGLRLSGGEKQRVAIARTIIKDPRIILLDEATAALDSTTEQNIQEALKTLSKGRTMLVIAHRLSTITTADQIIVLHAGRVAESGSHNDLLLLKGRYYSMWRKQIRAERAAEQASVFVAKAKKLSDAAMDRPGSPLSEDVSENETDTRAPSINSGDDKSDDGEATLNNGPIVKLDDDPPDLATTTTKS